VPIYSVPIENDTNAGVGPLRRTQNVLLVEPIVPIKLTPELNLVTRWITPVISEPRLAPSIGPEFGLGNLQPQFLFTPPHQGEGFVWGLGSDFWLPTATDKTLGVNKWGGGPFGVALMIQGPWLVGVLSDQVWAGTAGTSATGGRISTLTVEPFVFYNLPAGGWYLSSLPVITADWTVDAHNRWTVPIGGGFGRVFKVGDMLVNMRVQAFYDGSFAPAAGITNTGTWTAQFLLHFLFPDAPVPVL
jgi:hypothetical protein